MKDLLKKMRKRMAFNIIGAIVTLLVIFGVIVSAIGFVSFTNTFQREYAASTYHMADTAATLVNGDRIDAYLAGEEAEEYLRTKSYLDTYCQKMSVSLIYVISVDTSDYGRFVSVFNSVNNSVDNTEYTEWELGYKRDTTNDEYRQKYKELYEEEALHETVYRTSTKDGLHPHITTLVPIKDSAGKTSAILCIQRPARELVDARRPYLINIAISTFILAALASVLAGLFIRRQVLTPVKRVSEEASRFAKENTAGEALGVISRYEELMNLGVSIETMEADMVKYIDNLTSFTAEKERVSTELNMATQIQAGMLPSSFPAFPGRHEFDIYASMDPAREVGGDFYDYFLIDDDHLCMVMADVSGKGVPAALFMMASKIVLASNAVMGKSPTQILTDANAAICANNRVEMFVTVWLGILEISTGRLTAANAGHEYPAIRRAGGSFELLKDKHGFVIGGMEGVRYRGYELTLDPGDKLFLYTDGVPEATDADNNMFTTERMLEALNRDPGAAPQDVLRNVRKAVDDFVKDAEQFDDLTMLCMEYKERSRDKTIENNDL